MATHFVFPSSLNSLEDEPNDCRLYAQNPFSVTSYHPSQIEEIVKGVSFDLSDKDLFCIEEQDVFDRVYSLVKGFSNLTSSCKLNIVESLRSNFSVLLPNVDSLSRQAHGDNDGTPFVDRVALHRNAFRIYTFFLINIVVVEELAISTSKNNSKAAVANRKKTPKHSWNWESQRGRILNLIANSLEINLSLLFGSSDPDENYLSFIAKNVFHLFANSALLKDFDTKDALCRIIGTCATKYHYTAQSCISVLHLVHKYDFVVAHIADAVAVAEKRYADGSLATSLIREIGRTNPKDYVKDTVGAENVGRFLVELTDRIPKTISTSIGILIPHFGGESYKIRNALVGVLAKLVAKACKDEVSSKLGNLRTKQAMLEILLERCRDVSAYTRSRVLQVWAELCEERSISIGLWNEVASVAAGRLEDKSSIVRKSALTLLIMMLEHNPFGPQLKIASFEATLEKYKTKLSELEPNVPSEGVPDNSDSEVENGNVEKDSLSEGKNVNTGEESLTDSFLDEVENGIAGKDSSLPDISNLEQIRALVASLESGLSFSKCISATMPILVQLMASSSATDVENSILLLMRCKQFQIDGSEACLRKMLPLVFSQDKPIREAVENAFITIYITKNPAETAKNIMNLAIDSNIGDLAALEFIIGALVSKGDITSSITAALWDFFCFNVRGTTAEQSRGALSVLCMAAKSFPSILSYHLQDIIDIGFGRWAKVEPLLARAACIALQRLSEDDKKKLLSSNGQRLFAILESLITGSLPDGIWYTAADKAIGAIYSIHPNPEALAAKLAKKSLSSVLDCNESGSSTTVQVGKLGRFLFILSHIAMNHLVYIESCVKKIQKQKAKEEKMVAEGLSVDANGATPVDVPKGNGINAELGLAASEDAKLDTLSERAEKEILSGASNDKNLIGLCAPFLSKLCRNFSLIQKYPELHASAMLALCRLMIIDAEFCEANLQLLFTVVESAPSETVRSNCTIALGDLAVRFPNLLEPWTENMYARLRDPSVSVRKNAVLVLSHLILNDMMKVKGYIYEMAMRLEDEDERISNLAKLFFHELSKKGSNPIYNLLPDMLGKLSNHNMERESFCSIMQFLIGSIKKDKQMETLVEKLCSRFSGVSDVRQWEYISYCLSQLGFTEKGMKKLMESLKTYEHVLFEESVMENFSIIVNKAKKFAKPELKSCIEEFEEKLNKFHVEKKEQEITARNAEVHKQKVASLEGLMVVNKIREHSAEEDISDEGKDGEIIDPSIEGTTRPSIEGTTRCVTKVSKVQSVEKECSVASSEVTDTGLGGMEVQSPRFFMRATAGASKSRAKKPEVKDLNVDTSASVRRKTRSRKR